MARTREQLQSDLVYRIGDDTIDTDVSANLLNISWQEVLEYFVWPFRKSSATGTLASSNSLQTFSSVFGITDFKRMTKLLVGTNTEPYSRVDWEDSFDTSLTQRYAIDPNITGIKLPASDGGPATMLYVRHIPDISAGYTLVLPDGSVSGVPSQWIRQFEEAVIAGAAVRYFQNSLKFGSADYWQSQRNFYLDGVIDQLTTLSTEDQISIQTPLYNETGIREF